MKHDKFEDKKKLFDNTMMYYFTKRIFEDIEETDACNEKIIDSIGNIIKQSKDNWAFTNFDKLILSLKNSLGEKYLRSLLSSYEWIKDFDPLFIMNLDKTVDFDNIRKNLGMIVTQMEDVLYLPDNLMHNQEHIEKDETLNFCDKVSRSLTIATFLLYTLRNDKIPSDIDFDMNIAPSVEITFNIRPFKNYKECRDICTSSKLIDQSLISKQGIRKIVLVAKYLVDAGLLSKKVKRIENQSDNWENLAKLSKKYA